MEQRGRRRNAAVKTNSSVEESVGYTDTAHIAIHTMNLLHLGQDSIRLLQHKPFPTSVLLELPSEDDKMEAMSVFQKR